MLRRGYRPEARPSDNGSFPPIADTRLPRHPRTMRSTYKLLGQAFVFGFGAALFVALSWLVDSNHGRPVSVALTQVGATFFWVTVVAAAWLYFKRPPG